jgi:TonB family protein
VCAVLALAENASAQQCAHPNVRPATLSEAQPHFPELARKVGVSGDVTVDVTLDELSHVTSVAVENSPSKVLNAAALEAARNSVFQTEIRDCRPIAGTYRFIVVFDPDLPEAPEPSAVFGGSADAPTLTVVERGSASSAPDVATIRITLFSVGVDIEAANAADRMAYEAFVKTLHSFGIADRPVTQRSASGVSRESSAYSVTRFLSIRAKPGGETLHVLQAAAAADLPFASVQYAVSNDNGLYQKALADAERAADVRARSSVASQSLALGARTGVTLAAYREHAVGPIQTLRLVREDLPAVPNPPVSLQARTAITASYALRP